MERKLINEKINCACALSGTYDFRALRVLRLFGGKGVAKTGEVLYVYNWGEYISNGDDGTMDVNAQFEKETGIEVKYLNFSSNEEMYAKMKSGGMTVDVIIPSDYMIAQLIHENMLEKLDFDNIPNYDNIDEKFRKPVFDPTGEYSVAYTWGCTAIFYDSRYVDEADIDEDTWDLLWNEKYSGKILMFNNQRDAFGVAEAKLGYSLNTENQEELAACYDELVKQCPLVQGYYGDQIFDKMESGEAIIAPYYNGDLLMLQDGNENIKGYIPKGANTFIDSMCIPTCCQNKSAAEKYIDFMCREDVALANAEYIGYASPISAVKDELDEEVTGEFFYPSDEKLSNECEVFNRLSDETNTYLSTKWEDLMKEFTEKTR